MSQSFDFDFVEDESGGRFVPVGGPLVMMRGMLARQDIDGAVKIYEESGAGARDSLLAEAKMASFETKRALAQVLKRARDFAAAAEAFEYAKLDGEAAACYESANDFGRAAAIWKRQGELLKAAACFQRSGKIDEALALYDEAGSQEGKAECLARAGRYLEAATAYRALRNAHAEAEVLRAGLSADPRNLPCASRLAEMMLTYNRAQQAVQLLTDCARVNPAAQTDAGLLELLARCLDASGAKPAADKVRAHLASLPRNAAGQPVSIPQPTPTGPVPASALSETNDNAYGFLKALPLFAELTLADMKALYRVCTRVSFEPGQHLIEAGLPGRGLFVVIDGQVEVYAGPEPTARLLNTLGVGGHVGEISLVMEGPTSARVTARSAVKTLFISRDAFLQYMYNTPNAAVCIWRLFALNLSERVRVLSASK